METYAQQEVQRRNRRRHPGLWLIILILLTAAGLVMGKYFLDEYLAAPEVRQLAGLEVPDWVDVQLIGIDGSSRRGESLEEINDIVIHYVANPGTTAQQNRNWYANPESEVSSHFLVGLDGEVIQCIPLDEISSATNWRNSDTISIEVCHPDETGEFTEESYDALVELTAWLLEACDLDEDHIIRHYDVTGKDCPRYFVQNEDTWEQFKEDVEEALE